MFKFFALISSLFVSLLQHPFIKSSKPNSTLRALITDAMEIKLKRQEAEQREQDAEDDDNSVQINMGEDCRMEELSCALVWGWSDADAALLFFKRFDLD